MSEAKHYKNDEREDSSTPRTLLGGAVAASVGVVAYAGISMAFDEQLSDVAETIPAVAIASGLGYLAARRAK